MNLDNISENDIIKNYKELCVLLELPIETGGKKIKQMKWIEEYIKYEQNGHKFIIKKVDRNKKMLHIIDGRKLPENHKGAYTKYINLLILNMLSRNEKNNNGNNVIIMSKLLLFTCLNMINQNYRYGSYNRKALAKYLGIDIMFVDEFFDTNTRKIKEAVESSLNFLQKRNKTIDWTTIRMIKTTSGEHREPTEKEWQIIVDCEDKSLEEMGANDMAHIIMNKKRDNYYKLVNSKLLKHNIEYSYSAYKIVFSERIYKSNSQLKYRLDIDDEKDNMQLLNSTLCNKLLDSVYKRHDKTIEEINRDMLGIVDNEWLLKNKNYKYILMNDEYCGINNELIDILVKKGGKINKIELECL